MLKLYKIDLKRVFADMYNVYKLIF